MALFVALHDGDERCGQSGVEIDGVHFAGLDQRVDDGPVFGYGIMSLEEGVLSVEGNGADSAFDCVVVNLDATICQEKAKTVAVFGDVGERLTEGRFRRGASAAVDQAVTDAGKGRRRALLPYGRSGGGL